MGEDSIALGRQCFLEDVMEKGEDIHLLKEQHALPQLSRQEVPNCKSIASTNPGKPSIPEQQFTPTREPRENKLKGSIYPISILREHNEELHSRSRHAYKVWGSCDAALKVNRELQNVLLL